MAIHCEYPASPDQSKIELEMMFAVLADCGESLVDAGEEILIFMNRHEEYSLKQIEQARSKLLALKRTKDLMTRQNIVLELMKYVHISAIEMIRLLGIRLRYPWSDRQRVLYLWSMIRYHERLVQYPILLRNITAR